MEIFPAKRKGYFPYFLGVMHLIFLILTVVDWPESVGAAIVFVPVLGLLWWVFLGTWYGIEEGAFHYRSGPFTGTVPIKDIRKLELNITGYSGYKPAISTRGIILSYNKYDDMYISPFDNEVLANALKAINPEIVIVYANKN